MRTGSTLLRSALQSSPQVFVDNEIFNQSRRRFDGDFDHITANLLRRYPISVKAVGCKIFYTHLDDEEWLKFSSLPNFKIIHLLRRNLLRSYISLQIAQKTNQWIENKPGSKSPLKQRQVHVDHRKLIRYIQLSNAQAATARQRFKDHDVLDIYYEDMVTNFQQVVTSAIDFIGAQQWHKEKINLRRQNPESMRALIVNYDELKDAFVDTPWQVYFDEGQ